MTKKELRSILADDLLRFGKRPGIKECILHSEVWYIYNYIRHLRYIEYHKNKRGWHKVAYLYHFYRYKRLGFDLKFIIYPYTVASGLRIYHSGGFVHVGPNCKIGHNCSILPGVVFGNKSQESKCQPIIVGDNCFFGLDAKIFGPVKIGNNVTIGANSVITKDIPDNAVVGGVPAKIIRIKEIAE